MLSAHERLMEAARASSVAARALGLPLDDPQSGIDHDRDTYVDKLREDYRLEREANLAMREAVVAYGRRIRLNIRITFGLGILTLGVVLFVYSISQQNKEAIRVSCTVIKNAILESGGGGEGQQPTSAASKAQRENTSILLGAINRRLLTADEQRTVAANVKIIAKSGGVVSIPNCDKIAKDPQEVRELLLNRTDVPARRSPATPKP